MAADVSPGWMVPSARLWRMRLSQVAIAGPVLAVVAGVAARIPVGAWVGAAAAVVVAVAAGVVLWIERRRYRAWAYREQDDDLIVSRGVLVRRVSVVPYGRMQFVEVTAGPFERVFRLATVQLAGHQGLDAATPEPAEFPVITVPAGRVIGATLLRAVPRFAALAVIATVAAEATPGLFLTSESTLGVIALGLVTRTWQQLAGRYGFTVATSPDGIRIRRGLLSTVAETVPFGRVQAVRLVQPLLWRPFGWCRLVVDVAGVAGRDSGSKAGGLTKALLPVGPMSEAQYLVRLVFGPGLPELARPPKRARVKAPLSYHFLAAGHNEAMAVTVTGRVCKKTVYMKLEKLQSVRLTQGPVQRRLSLASVHGDAAGRRAHAAFADRAADQARELLDELAALGRSARSARSAKTSGPAS
jgi:putative membrane protein